MTPPSGDGSVAGNGSHSQSAYVNGKAAAPPPDPAQDKKSARRDAAISAAVLKALKKRDSNGDELASLADNVQPNGNRANGNGPNGTVDPDHPVHKATRGSGVLPPEVRKRLQADILPQVA